MDRSNNRIVNSAVITVRGGVRPVVVISLVMAVANLHKFTPNDVTHTRSATSVSVGFSAVVK